MRTGKSGIHRCLMAGLLVVAIGGAAVAMPVAYTIQVGSPDYTSVSLGGYVSDDVSTATGYKGPAFIGTDTIPLTLTSSTPITGTVSLRLGMTDYIQLAAQCSSKTVGSGLPFVAALFTAPAGYVFEETGSQYLYTRTQNDMESSIPGSPPNPRWFASSEAWGATFYSHGYCLVRTEATAPLDPSFPTSLGQPGYFGVAGIWSRSVMDEYNNPAYLDTAATLKAIPEPGTLALLAGGLAALARRRRRR